MDSYPNDFSDTKMFLRLGTQFSVILNKDAFLN